MMRSLSTAVSIGCLFVLAICLLLAHGFFNKMDRASIQPIFQTMDRIELQDARSALENGGLPALRAYLARLDADFGGTHLLLDRSGRDVENGVNHFDLLPPAPLTHARGDRNGIFTLEQQSADGAYWFIATKQSESVSFLSFYLLIIGIVLSLGALCTGYIVLPLRRTAAIVGSFGVGNMGVRIRAKRKDEIGILARSYDSMADRIEGAFKRERQLLQDLSHELRAPLARLSFSTKLARTAEDQQAALDEVKRDLDRLGFLVSELTALSISPLGGGEDDRQNTLVDLETMVAESVHDCTLESTAKHCSISCTGSAPELILGRPEDLKRAIDNVLRNAVRYSPQGATIEVNLKQSSEWSTISVRDFGPGVPKDLLDRIFDPFFQVDPARSAAQTNLGLGLCIARRAIESHHGVISAMNASPGLRISLAVPNQLRSAGQWSGARDVSEGAGTHVQEREVGISVER
jgi:two-component system sensor histidine kinase CpxA